MKMNDLHVSYLKFQEDYNRFALDSKPLFTVVGSIEKMMNARKLDYFTLPARQSKDGKKHTFYFEIINGMYVYSHCD